LRENFNVAVNGRHLGCEHCLNLISWFDTLNNREHKIDSVLIDFTAICLGELVNKASPDRSSQWLP
jgi:hypothetical protein